MGFQVEKVASQLDRVAAREEFEETSCSGEGCAMPGETCAAQLLCKRVSAMIGWSRGHQGIGT
jgi:hypothetical protein